MEHYKRKYAKLKGAMKLDHLPGDEVMIDFAGKKLSFVDKQLTKMIKDGCALLDLSLYDHLIVGKESYYSFCDEGVL